jgi:predicted short-subunit dehydrogenase-like oxidoreductase (DUF2520 family)
MINVILLGFGNVGHHLYKAMEASAGIAIVQIYNRSSIKDITIPQTQDLSKLAKADVYIIAVPDDSIATVSEELPMRNALVVHTSGGVSLNTLSEKNRRGIFYPLQTFSKNTDVPFNTIPICVEAEQEHDLELLESLGFLLSETVVEISSEERATLHLAAVFVNNFTNHLYQIAADITSEKNINFELLKPLVTETARKIESLPPSEVQTGPAKRKDQKTIEKHLKLLEGTPYRSIYQALTNSIQHGKKL